MDHTINDPRLDASESAYLNNQLEYIRSHLYEVLLGPVKGRKLVPVTNEVPSGAESDSYNIIQTYGSAKVGGSGYTTTPPRADVSTRKVLNSIVPVTNAYGYTLNDIRNAAQSGMPLPSLKGKAAKLVMARTIDELLLVGSTAEGLAGLFTLSGALSQAPGTGAAGDTWALKTSEEIVADLFAMEHTIVSNSLEALIPNTLVLPLTAKQEIASRRMRDGSDTTIMEFFLATSENIKSIETSSRLESAPNSEWVGRRAMAYTNDAMHVEAIIPQEFEQLPPQIVNYETVVNCHMRYGGIRTYQPESVLYMDNI